jgi:hypothetical protein
MVVGVGVGAGTAGVVAIIVIAADDAWALNTMRVFSCNGGYENIKNFEVGNSRW